MAAAAAAEVMKLFEGVVVVAVAKGAAPANEPARKEDRGGTADPM